MTDSVHVCILSDQCLANLIPILMEKPATVYLIATPEMIKKDHGKRMKRLLRKTGAEPRIRDKTPSTGLEKIRVFANKTIEQIQRDETDKRIVLNATGGPKLLSMGFVEAFREHLEGNRFEVIYTDTEHQLIESLVPASSEARPTQSVLDSEVRPMQSVLDIETYLAAQGMKLDSAQSEDKAWHETAENRLKLTGYLAEHSEKLKDFFSVLNGLVHGFSKGDQGALPQDGNQLLTLKIKPQGIWHEAMIKIADQQLVKWDGDKKVIFASAEAKRYLSGRWLEEWAWHVAREEKLDHVHCSVKVRRDLQSGPGTPDNEFDVLAVHNNRLLLVECKTGCLNQGQEITNRLESLGRNVGGLFGSTLLLSVKPLSSSMEKRCRNQSITVACQSNISKLGELIRHWRDTGHLPDVPAN